jgi:hypothetical protein
MLLDKQNIFTDNILVSTIPAGVPTLQDVIDLLGGGTAQTESDITPNVDGLEVVAVITDAAVAGGTSLQLQLVTGATSGAVTTVVNTGAAIVTASLIQGYRFGIEVPTGFALQRWLGVNLIQAGTAFTGTGRITVALVPSGGQQTAQL